MTTPSAHRRWTPALIRRRLNLHASIDELARRDVAASARIRLATFIVTTAIDDGELDEAEALAAFDRVARDADALESAPPAGHVAAAASASASARASTVPVAHAA